MVNLSIAICTYNRAKYLDLCLDSITRQNVDKTLFEILIIDNNSLDNTYQIFEKYSDTLLNLRYVVEAKIGLSYARNRAIKEAKSNWIAYVDDDAILFEDYINIALKTIDNYDFVCFGGNYFAKYLEKKPKWIDNDFGSNGNLIKNITRVYKDNAICGCNMVFSKKVLIEVGGFLTDLGMKGNKLRYGEENLILKRILEKNLPIGFEPELKIYHIIMPHKYILKWHLNAIYSHGRDRAKINNINTNKLTLLYYLIKSIIKSFLSIPMFLIKFRNKNYYWQNFILDVLNSVLYTFGRIRAK